MSLKDWPGLARTVAHLRLSQIFWRGRYALRRRYLLSSHTESPPLPAEACQGDPLTQLGEQLREHDFPSAADAPMIGDQAPSSSRLSRGVFRHLTEERPLGRPPDWLLGPRDRGRLWTVTPHYHHMPLGVGTRRDRGSGYKPARPGGRHPSRIISTIGSSDAISIAAGGASPGVETPTPSARVWNSGASHPAARPGLVCWPIRNLPSDMLTSWRQGLHPCEQYRMDLRGNHLVRDAVGDWPGRVAFSMRPDVPPWLAQAAQLARDQAREQVLPDGGHFLNAVRCITGM